MPDKVNERSAGLLGVGFLWLLTYMPLSQASGQIQEEKIYRTMYHLFKAPIKKWVILFGKLSMVVFFGVISLLIYVLIGKALGLSILDWSFQNVLLLLLILIHSAILGYFLGIVLKNGVALATLILTLPAMILSGLPRELPFKLAFEMIPTYHSGILINDMLMQKEFTQSSVYILLGSCILFVSLSVYLFNKADVIKWCES